MKSIILKSLTMTNWRDEQNRTTDFNDVSTTIAGGNGLGKSRHFDAFMWLLFGKDKEDRKDFNIKSIVDGQPLTRTDSEVVGVLDVDGEVITLRRVFAEDWIKPRGQVEQVFKGNKTECYWNDTPVSVTEYQKRVNGIIDDSVFKMVTNPYFFANMKWQDQREQLFQLAGTITDHEIAGKSLEFAALLDRIGGKSFADFKKELSARKKRLKDDLAQIQPRIDQTQKLMPEVCDFAAVEAEIADIEAEIEKIDKAITDVTERAKQQFEATQERQGKINALKSKRQQVLFDAQSKAKEEAFGANANRRELQERINATRREIQCYAQDENSANTQLERLQKQVQDLTAKTDDLRADWFKENEATYNGETTCSCCGQELPEAMKEEARERFNQYKQARLNEITRCGKVFKTDIEETEKRIAEAEQDKQNAIAGSKEKEDELRRLEQELADVSEVKQAEVNPDEIEEYAELTKQIADLEEQLNETHIYTDSTDAYKTRKKELSDLRDEAKTKLADRERIEQFKKQIADLEAKGKDLAQQIADAESEEYTVRQFTKAKIDECEKRINSLFTMVTFRLFDYTIEDSKKENPIETCVPLVNGVPFAVANTAGQVNAGLDIINALTRFYGVTAPIFIDNRESINEIIDTKSQVINLEVTDDKYLVIK